MSKFHDWFNKHKTLGLSGIEPGSEFDGMPYKAYSYRVGITFPDGHHETDIRWGEIEIARRLNEAYFLGKRDKMNEAKMP